jgi:hypothetical protein
MKDFGRRDSKTIHRFGLFIILSYIPVKGKSNNNPGKFTEKYKMRFYS